MKTSPCPIRWLLGCALLAAAAGRPALAQSTPPPPLPIAPGAAQSPEPGPTLAQALDAAWQRSLEAAEAAGRQRQAAAEQAVAASWLADTASLELSRRQGRGAADGSSETELALALPLWRLGQRQQQAQAAQAGSDWAVAAERAARLRLAGQLREQAGRLRQAEAELRLADRQARLLEQLAADVERRVRAGDLAPADALAARAEALAAHAAEAEARQSLEAQRGAWALLSGTLLTPLAEPAPPAGASALEQHAELLLAEAAVRLGAERAAQLRMQRAPAPELGLGLRQDRPGLGQPTQHALALSLRIPIGPATHGEPRLAAALAEQDLALRHRLRLRLRLESELALARSQLAASQAQAAAETERARLLRERARLIDKSFQAGETALPELLRALSAAAQADAASARQDAARDLAGARLQQAQGTLP